MKEDELEAYAVALVEELEENGLRARLFGGVAIRLVADYEGLFARNRRIRDFDVVADWESQRAVWQYLQRGKWRASVTERFIGHSRKAVLWHSSLRLRLDLYVDPLVFCHKLKLGSRLEMSSPTISPTDLLLTKLQVMSLTDTDLRDIAALLGTVPESSLTEKGLNRARVVEVCRHDWGWFHTCLNNLEKVMAWSRRNAERRTEVDRVEEVSSGLLRALLEAPKTLRWKVRKAIGPRIPWYFDVE